MSDAKKQLNLDHLETECPVCQGKGGFFLGKSREQKDWSWCGSCKATGKILSDLGHEFLNFFIKYLEVDSDSNCGSLGKNIR